jgi:hypothetical protein
MQRHVKIVNSVNGGNLGSTLGIISQTAATAIGRPCLQTLAMTDAPAKSSSICFITATWPYSKFCSSQMVLCQRLGISLMTGNSKH